MKHARLIGGGLAAVTAAGSLLVVWPAAAATTHTLKLRTADADRHNIGGVQVASRRLMKQHSADPSKVIGVDAERCKYSSSGAKCVAELALAKGTLGISYTVDGPVHGTVLGGTGEYTGAKGTVSGHGLSANVLFTIHWHT